jgi:hypothetical protein
MFLFWAALGLAEFSWAFRSNFWLCRARGELLWIRCARAINPTSQLVIELKRCDLAWVEPVKLSFTWKYARGGREIKFYRYLDIGLSESAAAILEQFASDPCIATDIREQIAPPPAVYNQLVRRVRAGVIRINWGGMSPGLNEAGKHFSNWTELRPLRRERVAE